MTKSIEVRELSKVYAENGISIFALNNINIEIRQNTFSLIMGPSGSGKSTLLHLLGGLDKPTSGSIEIGEYNLNANATDTTMADYRHKNIGFIFQSFHLITNMTVLDNISFPQQLSGVNRANREKAAKILINKVGLSENLLNLSVNKLSGGEKQRVAIARALINNPNIILADEPTGNLDLKTGNKIIELLLNLRYENRTVVMVTHDERFKSIADQVFYIVDGRKIE
jgi:ABC-type lipoprotein export system ATPase subunit